MLKKLLKYEFKSVSRMLVPLLLGTLGLAVIAAGLFTLNYRYISGTETDTLLSNIFPIILTTVLVFAIIAIFASALVVFFILLQRYYKNFFGDEGYLTFTLPVGVNKQLFSKLISGFVWMLLSMLTVIVSGMLLIGFGTAETGEIVNTEPFIEIGNAFRELFDAIGTLNTALYIIEGIFLFVFGFAAQIMLLYLAITIGSIIAKKHKILASIGVYFGINTVVGMLSNIAMVTLFWSSDTLERGDVNAIYTASHSVLIVLILLAAVMGVTAFMISSNMLRKKLNLE